VRSNLRERERSTGLLCTGGKEATWCFEKSTLFLLCNPKGLLCTGGKEATSSLREREREREREHGAALVFPLPTFPVLRTGCKAREGKKHPEGINRRGLLCAPLLLCLRNTPWCFAPWCFAPWCFAPCAKQPVPYGKGKGCFFPVGNGKEARGCFAQEGKKQPVPYGKGKGKGRGLLLRSCASQTREEVGEIFFLQI
jgi:hypothetical protein